MERLTLTAATGPAPKAADLVDVLVDLGPMLAHAGPQLYPGDLFQVLDNYGTWHAATVGEGVLCKANRDVRVQTTRWEYATDLVSCTAKACVFALGRR